jgi:hypothetical protein
MAVVMVMAILAAVVVPLWGTGTAAAAPALLETSFRDLPASVSTGDTVRVQLDVPNGATCEGSILYRDNTSQPLGSIKEANGLCRWDVVVPDATRRGEADISVAVKKGSDAATVSAVLNVVRRTEEVGLELKDFPGTVKRNDGFKIRVDVPNGSTCHGLITYDDARTQALDPQPEQRERCRWELTVPADAVRGQARVVIAVTEGGRQTILSSSFEVGRDTEDAELLAAFQNLPGAISRDVSLPIRVLAPAGSSCSGEISFRSTGNAVLGEVQEQDGMCRWSTIVPPEAMRGEAWATVRVKNGRNEVSISAVTTVNSSATDVNANFKDLPTSVRRGDDLKVRVTVPEGSNCQGDVRFDDGTVAVLEGQAEEKDRCLWTSKVPRYTARGKALVRVVVDDQGSKTTLIGNVLVEGSEDEEVTASWSKMPKNVEPGEEFDVAVKVASGSSCTGKITFADGTPRTLGNTQEDDSRCRWSVEVPGNVGPGKAAVEVKVTRKGEASTLASEIEVKAAEVAVSPGSR